MMARAIRISTTLLAIITATAIQYLISLRGSYGPVGLCPDLLPDTNPSASAQQHPDLVEIDGISGRKLAEKIRAQPCHSFSESYYEARAKFRHAAQGIAGPGVELQSLQVIPGKDYTIDIVVISGDGDGLVIHSSGCHGVEGFSGSAVQVSFLNHLASLSTSDESSVGQDNEGEEKQNKLPTIIFVHALNPYGMAHYRRTNENNVDLNRNALTDNQWPEVLGRDPNIAGYDNFDETMFNPRRAPTLFGAYVTVFFNTITSIARYGFVNMKRSMVSAQYHNPRGIFYGGTELQASHALLRDWLVDKGYTATSGTVTWIDVHTGLGPTGVDTLLVHGVPDDTTISAGAGVDKWFPDAPRPVQYHSGHTGESSTSNRADKMASDANSDVTAGYDLSKGSVNEYYAKLFDASPSTRPLIVSQEFGTVSGIMVARGLILENMSWNYAPKDQPTWSTFSRAVFYVRTDEWRRSILTRGLTVLRQAIERSISD